MKVKVTGRTITLGPAVRRLNPGVANPDGTVSVVAAAPPATPRPEAASPGQRIRQESKPLLNKLEGRWLAALKATLPPGTVIHAQSKRYRLANGIWFKPDFVAAMAGKEVAWEVKGPHAFRGGFENLKVAAEQWPDVEWRLVWEEAGQWRQQAVAPAGATFRAASAR